MDQLTLAEAHRRGEVGQQRAIDHAGPEWADAAYAWLEQYLRHHSHLWPDSAREHGCPPPPDWRAMGAVVRRAARCGLIERDGYAPRKSGNCTPSPVWRSMVWDGAA